MKVFKKILAVLCSATMIVSAPVTAFASDAGTTATGNVIAYTFDTVTVPTTIKIAFNPQGLPITTGEGVTTTDQIVSLGYGIANKASTDKKVVVKFAASAVAVDGEEADVEFVATADEATAVSETNANGAAAGEHKIFLYVAPATAQPTINDGSDTAFAIASDGTENATAANLADVKMTAAAAAKGIAFAEGSTYDAFANVGFALDKATYALKAGESIDFDTTQAEVAEKLQISAFGTTSITGFTFKGNMNANTVWTKANITAISITPIYEFTEKGEEASVADTHGMITLTEDEDTAEPAAPVVPATTYTVTYNANYDGAEPATKTETVDIGEAPQGGSEYEFTRDGFTQDGWLDAADGDPVDLSTIDAATTVYANWVEDEPAVTTYALQVVSGTGNLKYTFAEADKPTGSLTAISINGTNRPAVVTSGGAVYNSNGNFVITKATVDNANMGIVEGGTTIVATIGDAEYTFTY